MCEANMYAAESDTSYSHWPSERKLTLGAIAGSREINHLLY